MKTPFSSQCGRLGKMFRLSGYRADMAAVPQIDVSDPRTVMRRMIERHWEVSRLIG